MDRNSNNNSSNKTDVNETELVRTNKLQKSIKWLKIQSSDEFDNNNNKTIWKPVYILRCVAPNRNDYPIYIGRTADDNKYRQYHIDELYDTPDFKKCSKNQIINTMMQSLHALFSQTTINEDDITPMYLYQKSSNSKSLLSSFNPFGSDTATLSLQPVRECELHDAAALDDTDRDVTGVWITTDSMKEKTYMSIEKLKTIQYIDDVNPVQYIHDDKKIQHDDWVMIDDDEEENKAEDAKLNEEVRELRLQRSNSSKLIEDLKAKHDAQQQENQRLSLQMTQIQQQQQQQQQQRQHVNGAQSASETTLNQQINQQRKSLEEKQTEIDRLRRELIARSNAKQLNSKFPTVEEVCTEYRSIKNQEFQTVHSKLTKPLRKKYKNWNKYYVNKLSHKLLFNTLIQCYNHTLSFHDEIYKSIGNILQIKYVTTNNNNDGDGDYDDEKKMNGDNGDKQKEQEEKPETDHNSNGALEFLFHRYLTNNFETMKESEQFKQIKNVKILENVKQEYKEIIDSLSEQEQDELIAALKVFIMKCCDVCWTMVLQRPKLTISPSLFIPNEKIEFDENKQTRILGSNKRDRYILYFVWPGIAQNETQLDNVKVYVVQRDEDFAQTK